MKLETREMTAGDYDEVFRLWESAEGVGLTDADSKEGVETYLNRNPGLSLVACQEGQIVGAILGGHDGRRGYLHHLAVAQKHRRQGVGSALVRECLARLAASGIHKCHAWVYQKNEEAQAFWRKIGWSHRDDLVVVSREVG